MIAQHFDSHNLKTLILSDLFSVAVSVVDSEKYEK